MNDSTYLKDEIRKNLYNNYSIEISNRGVRSLMMHFGRAFTNQELTIMELMEFCFNNLDLLASFYFGQESLR